MEYRVVELKWSRDGNFVGQPPFSIDQDQLTKALNGFAKQGWSLVDIHHEVDSHLRFSIITLARRSSPGY